MAKIPAPNIIQTPAHPNNYTRGRVAPGLNGQLTHHHIVGTADSAVSVFQNPNRQASSTYIITAILGTIYQPVAEKNTPYTDGNWASNNRALTFEHHGTWLNGYRNENVIFNSAWTLAWLRDRGLVNHTFKHREVSQIPTQCCGDLPEQEIWNLSSKMLADPSIITKRVVPAGTTKPKPSSNLEWKKLDKPKVYVVPKGKTVNLWDFDTKTWAGAKSVKKFKAGERITIYGKVWNKALKATYLVTEFSYKNKIANGFNIKDLEVYVAPKPAKPEWEKNLKPVKAAKLTVLTKQAPIVHLESGDTIKQLGSGTQVDVLGKTTFKGVEYYLSAYSVKNSMPNGIPVKSLGVPAAPPKNEKPEWLKNWNDIEDVDMYARADTDLVDLMNGDTIKVIKRGEKLRIASTTEWYGHKYAITEYSTERNQGRGIRIDDLDMKPIQDPPAPAPTQPTLEENVDWTADAVRLLLDHFGIDHPTKEK